MEEKKYYTAPTYTNWERCGKPFTKEGKLYQTVKEKCDRCTKGVFVARVENGQIIPHPAYGGVCLKCGGLGYLQKDVRLYTESEFDSMQKSKERAAAKRQQEQEEKMKREYAEKRRVWNQTNGFNENEEAYIVIGDSYSIKDQLKDAGFRFNGTLKRWMRGTANGYEEQTIKFNAAELVEYSAWGEGHYLSNAKKLVDEREAAIIPQEVSEWIGEVGSALPALTVTLVRVSPFYNQWGQSFVYKFKDNQGNNLTWFSKCSLKQEVGDTFTIKATVKSHDTYNDVKQTVITRAKIID